MQLVADLHLHSKYSRAVSKQMTLSVMAEKALVKGINLLATGDFTHPVWIKELETQLVETAAGVYAVNGMENQCVRYLFGTEIACIYSQGGKGRRVHVLVFAPSLTVVHTVNECLKKRGINLSSDGRPIIGLSVFELCELLFSVSEDIIVIPAHVWTPWFGMLGSKSGFDSVRECFGKYAENIYAIETGLSSDPAMNWRVEEFGKRSIVSFSDAHSPERLGRELTIFENEAAKGIDAFCYKDFIFTLKQTGPWLISTTIEFYPEEGKYHVDGHRVCGVRQTPEETRKAGRQCPVCGKTLTLGVLGRVDQIAKQEVIPRKAMNEQGVAVYSPPKGHHKPYIMVVPLTEIIAQSLGKGEKTQTVLAEYDRLVKEFGSELNVLLRVDVKALQTVAGDRVAQAVAKVRSGDIFFSPGYDGVFGTVSIWDNKEETIHRRKQLMLF